MLNTDLSLKSRSHHNLSRLLEETPEAYYWMGFILADGYISYYRENPIAISIDLAPADCDHLAKFSAFVGADAPVIYKPSTSGSGRVRVRVPGRAVIPLILNKFGVLPNKTTNPPTVGVDWMSDELFLSYLIGLIDGDGLINKANPRYQPFIRIRVHSSWKCYLSLIDRRLSSISGSDPLGTRDCKSGYVQINWGDRATVKMLRLFTVDYDLPVLNRKWSRVSLTNTFTESQDGLRSSISSLFRSGLTRKEIASRLGMPLYTVSYYIRSTEGKYAVHSI